MSQQRRHMGLYQRLFEAFGRSPFGNWYARKLAPLIDPPLLRLTGGRVSTLYPFPVMLLTTIGAKSGLRRTHPLVYAIDGDRLMLIASNYGGLNHPAWYRNLVANPKVDVLAGKHSGTYIATRDNQPRRAGTRLEPRGRHLPRLCRLRGSGRRSDDPAGPLGAGARLSYPQS
jgi:deazaflavin-dependent oxidoreductase (nitroreductase family)